MSEIFEKKVLEKLSSIEERLSSIEERFEEATDFADGILSDENGLLGKEGLSSLKDTLSAFIPSQVNTETMGSGLSDPESLNDLVGSLKDFRDRLTGIKSAIAEIPVDTDGEPISDE